MHVLVIENPRSGQGDGGLYTFVRELVTSGASVEVRRLGSDGDVDGVLRGCSGYDRVVAGGGDGTASAIAYALRGTGTPILAYPAGTANLLTLNLGLPTDPKRLADIALFGDVVPTDLGELEDDGRSRGFAVMAGAGFDANVMEGAAELKSTLGVGAYFLSVMRNLAPTVARFRLDVDGERVETDGIAVMLVNFAKIQFDLAVTHGSASDDGLLEVVILRMSNVVGLIPTVWQALLDRIGSVPERAGLQVLSGREIRVESDPPLPVQFDGEVADATTPLVARVLPNAAAFLVPRSR